ncbi:S4 domain-containing protein YaaA [Lactobacillus intestinalis]|nr:S4 domain-containing protein YaaA [Lactobacillus intestinalis]
MNEYNYIGEKTALKVSIIKVFKISGDYITLSQFLKEESIISSGGQAKWYLKDNPVVLNGKKEDRRGKKLYPGDELEIAEQKYEFR